jgi:hypothetical protein
MDLGYYQSIWCGSKAQRLLQELVVVSPNVNGYSLQDGLIKFKGKVWVGANTTLQTKIIQAFHALAMGVNSGIQATYQKLHKLYFWTGLKTLVDSFVK